VSVTNPWLAGPSPTRRLDRARLEERIFNLLSSQNMCVLATLGPDGPLATPVRYFHLDFTIVFTASGASPKMRNIAADPRVSVATYAPLVGQASSRGAQLFGQARVLTEVDPDFAGFWAGTSTWNALRRWPAAMKLRHQSRIRRCTDLRSTSSG